MGRSRGSKLPVDMDRAHNDDGIKAATRISKEEFDARADERAGLRELDDMVQTTPGIHWATARKERAIPKSMASEPSNPRLVRPLLADGAIRKPASERQTRARNHTRLTTLQKAPESQIRAVSQLSTLDEHWNRVNDQLSDHVGDITELSEKDRAEVYRTDMFIQRYERANDRGHVVYAPVEVAGLTAGGLEEFSAATFKPGTVIDFDRYTMASHNMHEAADRADPYQSVMLEIQTTRGAYLGSSHTGAGHLLPRGMSLKVVGTQMVTFAYPDGREDQRIVLQLTDDVD